jgi:hypothetical protein
MGWPFWLFRFYKSWEFISETHITISDGFVSSILVEGVCDFNSDHLNGLVDWSFNVNFKHAVVPASGSSTVTAPFAFALVVPILVGLLSKGSAILVHDVDCELLTVP